VSDNFQIHTLFQTVIINVGFLYLGQISFDIPTWHKCLITTKCQVAKSASRFYFQGLFLFLFLLNHSIKVTIIGKNQVGILIVREHYHDSQFKVNYNYFFAASYLWLRLLYGVF